MEITGYRCWDVQSDGTLVAPVVGGRWVPGPNTARCKAIAHRQPLASCSCGYYALHEPIAPAAGEVAGVISGWGDVAVQADGWRAEHAQVVALAIPPRAVVLTRRGLVDFRELAERAAAMYGVPLVDEAQLGVLAGEHGEAVPVEMRPARASRIYEQIARRVRAIPLARRLLLAVERYGPVVVLAAFAWTLAAAATMSSRALLRWSGPPEAVVLLLASVVMAAGGIGYVRHANGRWRSAPGRSAPGGPFTFLRVTLASGLLLPWLASDLHAPQRVTYAMTLFAAFCAFGVLTTPTLRATVRLAFRSKVLLASVDHDGPVGLLSALGVAAAVLIPAGAILYVAINVAVLAVDTLGWWLVPAMCATALLTRSVRPRGFKPLGGAR
jgi:hypothetical protein